METTYYETSGFVGHDEANSVPYCQPATKLDDTPMTKYVDELNEGLANCIGLTREVIGRIDPRILKEPTDCGRVNEDPHAPGLICNLNEAISRVRVLYRELERLGSRI